jgi:hypothetical protein
VDSAEADKVGSREIRFCAYVSVALYQGVRHRRTTPGALIYFPNFLLVPVIAGFDSHRRPDQGQPGGTSSFRICDRSATSNEPAICVPVVA